MSMQRVLGPRRVGLDEMKGADGWDNGLFAAYLDGPRQNDIMISIAGRCLGDPHGAIGRS
jgi:hypothetical protein